MKAAAATDRVGTLFLFYPTAWTAPQRLSIPPAKDRIYNSLDGKVLVGIFVGDLRGYSDHAFP